MESIDTGYSCSRLPKQHSPCGPAVGNIRIHEPWGQGSQVVVQFFEIDLSAHGKHENQLLIHIIKDFGNLFLCDTTFVDQDLAQQSVLFLLQLFSRASITSLSVIYPFSIAIVPKRFL